MCFLLWRKFLEISLAILGDLYLNFFDLFNALQEKLYGVMYAIEINHDNGWTNFMLECDFLVMVKAFTNTSIVAWRLQNIRPNCLILVRSFRFRSSYILEMPMDVETNCIIMYSFLSF